MVTKKPTTTRKQQVFTESGKGRKQCKSCSKYIPSSSRTCPNCHEPIVTTSKATTKNDKRTVGELRKSIERLETLGGVQSVRAMLKTASELETKLATLGGVEGATQTLADLEWLATLPRPK